jgi:hypothetical protein
LVEEVSVVPESKALKFHKPTRPVAEKTATAVAAAEAGNNADGPFILWPQFLHSIHYKPSKLGSTPNPVLLVQ